MLNSCAANVTVVNIDAGFQRGLCRRIDRPASGTIGIIGPAGIMALHVLRRTSPDVPHTW